MPADPVTAGRKGGRSRSAAKIAAAKQNGFQARKPAQEQSTELQLNCGCVNLPTAVLVFVQPKAEEE